MLIHVPPTESFDVPEGRYNAVCDDTYDIHKSTDKGPKTFLRVIWRILDSPDPNVVYMAGKSYEPVFAKNSQLSNDLHSWFQQDIKPGPFDPHCLPGLKATLTIAHIHNEGYPKPYCYVAKVEPPQTR